MTGFKKARLAAGKFTLIEMLVVISIIAVLASILLPALNAAKNRAQGAVCVNKLKQLILSELEYADDNDGRLPSPWDGKDNWSRVLGKAGYAPEWSPTKNFSHFHCPCWPPLEWSNFYGDTYAMAFESDNGDYEYQRLFGLPTNWPVVSDSISLTTMKQYYYIGKDTKQNRIHLRHFGKGNVVFPDGHVSGVEGNDVTAMGFYYYK